MPEPAPSRPARAPRRWTAARPIRLLIVDDSIVARSILARLLGELPDFEIVATAAGVGQALEALGHTSVDIVLLDVAMPGTDGLTALPEIIARGDGARVLIVSSIAAEGAEACVRALALGAADTLPKPSAGGGFGGPFATLLADKLRAIGHAERGAARATIHRAPAAPIHLRPMTEAAVECLAIGASTGGLHALGRFFAALPQGFRAPILVTQHLPAAFMPFFAEQLRALARRPAAVARDGQRLRAGELIIAPGDAHLGLRRVGGAVHVRLEHGPVASACLPSVDPMIDGLAACYGAGGLAVILTGMGRDGALGAAALAAAGGEVIAQDEATAVVWGMPGAVAAAGLASLVAEPARLAAHVARRAMAYPGPD